MAVKILFSSQLNPIQTLIRLQNFPFVFFFSEIESEIYVDENIISFSVPTVSKAYPPRNKAIFLTSYKTWIPDIPMNFRLPNINASPPWGTNVAFSC